MTKSYRGRGSAFKTNRRIGENTTRFKGVHVNFDLNNSLNKQLGHMGELLFSQRHPGSYYLYRIFNYDEACNNGSMYVLHGDLEQHLLLKPLTFKVTRV